MKIFLTGATGYIGHQLAKTLAQDKHELSILVRNPESDTVPKLDNIHVHQGDLCDYPSVYNAMKDSDYVFHVAAFTDMKCNDVNPFYNTNVVGTENVLKSALASNIQKVVYTSTLAVFGPALYHVPITEHQPRLRSFENDYELTKTMSEELVKSYVQKGLSCCILNVSRVYGPGLATFSNGVNKLMHKIMKQRVLVVPDQLKVEANYVYIDDVVDAQLKALRYGESGENYIIGGENADYKTLFALVRELTGSDIRILTVPYNVIRSLIKAQADVSNLFRMQPLLTPKVLDSLFTHRSASCEKALTTLKYRQTPLEEGIAKTIQYLKTHPV